VGARLTWCWRIRGLRQKQRAGVPAPHGQLQKHSVRAFVSPTSRKVREKWGTLADLVPTNSRSTSRAAGGSARTTLATSTQKRAVQAFVFPTSRKVREEWGTLG
jgi:hypothetical protein